MRDCAVLGTAERPDWRGIFIAIAVTLACGVAVHCEDNGDGEQPTKASIELRVYPRTFMAPGEAKVTIIVHDEDQQLVCPAFVIDFGDGCRTVREEWCDGLQLQRDRPTTYAPVIPLHKYRKKGEYEVTVRVVDYEVVLMARERIIVAGLPPLGE